MVDYEKLYHIMVDASEKAIEAVDAQNYGAAKDILIRAEREAEERYIQTAEPSDSGIPTSQQAATKSDR